MSLRLSCRCLGAFLLVGCGAPAKSVAVPRLVPQPGPNIDALYEDGHGRTWFGSNGGGAYLFDGTTLTHFTTEDGLCSDSVWRIHGAPDGSVWFTTWDSVCRFDGKTFVEMTDAIRASTLAQSPDVSGIPLNTERGVCFYDGERCAEVSIVPKDFVPDPTSLHGPYEVYTTTVDTDGVVWFGTQSMGVAVYDGREVSYFVEDDLAGPAVRAIFQDSRGVMWFGNNGGGLYRYDGEELRNITVENDLGNEHFLRGMENADMPGTLARVFAINEDADGSIWVGTVDAGVWRVDGERLTNYTKSDGLPSLFVPVIYKAANGELWFIAGGEAIFEFNGTSFVPATY